MTKGNTRIRWTEDERNSVLAAYRTLHASEPHGDITRHFASAQKTLPAKRRRTLDYSLRVWLKTEGAQARGRTPASKTVIVPPGKSARSPLTKKTTPRPETSTKSAPTSAAVSPSVPPHRDNAHASTIPAGAESAALERLLVERGSKIVADILGSARVQQALRALLHAAWPSVSSSAPVSVTQPGDRAATTNGEADAVSTANGKLRVLIAGMDKHEGATLAKTYDDTLELACWSADEGLELLRAAVERADVVVGMANLLSQPVEQTLRRHARRYLRSARGVAGLRGELASLALSGHGVTAAEDVAAHRT